MKSLKFAFAMLLLFSVGATTQNLHGKQSKVENQNALLYEITGNGVEKPSYIFGTIHIICPKDMIPMEKFDSYFNKSDQLILELDLNKTSELANFSRLTKLRDGTKLSDYLTKEQYEKIDEMTMKFLKTPFSSLQTSHPITFHSMLLTSPHSIGCNPVGSYEVSFLQLATAKGKPIEGLETVAMQMKSLNKTPLKKQALGIYKIAQDTDKYFADFQDLVNVYKTQDSFAIYKVLQTQFKTQYAHNPAFQTNILDARNLDWIPKIEKAIKEKPSFIGVGAGHLGGEKGVLKLLKKKGYKLKPIRF